MTIFTYSFFFNIWFILLLGRNEVYMYERAIDDLEQSRKSHYLALREYVYLKSVDEDPEFRNITEKMSKLYNDEKIISKMVDGFTVVDKVSDDDRLNKIFRYLELYRKQEDMMEFKMYLRGMSDCLRLLGQIDKIK